MCKEMALVRFFENGTDRRGQIFWGSTNDGAKNHRRALGFSWALAALAASSRAFSSARCL
jgi:hypothetical protein